MKKYIDANRLRWEIKKQIRFEELSFAALGGGGQNFCTNTLEWVLKQIDTLQQEQTDMGEVSDGYHTFNELYYYRMLYNAAFFNLLPKEWVHKSKRHHTGEECFGGGWFIVIANLPTGQVSNHYELKDWDLFKVPEKEFADEWDGHTPQEAAERLHKYLQQEQPEVDLEKEVVSVCKTYGITEHLDAELGPLDIKNIASHFYEMGRNAKNEEAEQPEYGYITTKYIQGKKPRWKVGDILAYYINNSDEEGEDVLGKVVKIRLDEIGGWLYTFENEDVWDEESLITEGTYEK